MRSFVKVICVVILAVSLNILDYMLLCYSGDVFIGTITDKEYVIEYLNGFGEDCYYIYCRDDGGNYRKLKNTGNYLGKKFDFSIIYKQLNIGQRYVFTVVRAPIRLITDYEYIIKVDHVK